MRSIRLGFPLLALVLVLLGASGCGKGVNESKFSPTPGSASPDAPKTPEEVDARTPKSTM